MKNNETLRLRLSEDLKKDLQELADADQRKLSDYIRIQLEKFVATSKKKGK
jgi:predicted transcriptional regulator